MYQGKTVGAVILAAGKSSRTDGGVNKVYRQLAGKPVLIYSLDRFIGSSFVDRFVLVYNEDDEGTLRDEVSDEIIGDYPITCVPGGERRQDSSWEGLRQLETDYVFVHDGARPNFSVDLVQNLLKTAVEYGASYPGLKPVDTIRRLKDGFSGQTVDRDSLVRVQTPQCFKRGLLVEAIGKSLEVGEYYTDDAGAVLSTEAAKPRVVPGERGNIKLTTDADFAIIEKFLGGNGD